MLPVFVLLVAIDVGIVVIIMASNLSTFIPFTMLNVFLTNVHSLQREQVLHMVYTRL